MMQRSRKLHLTMKSCSLGSAVFQYCFLTDIFGLSMLGSEPCTNERHDFSFRKHIEPRNLRRRHQIHQWAQRQKTGRKAQKSHQWPSLQRKSRTTMPAPMLTKTERKKMQLRTPRRKKQLRMKVQYHHCNDVSEVRKGCRRTS